MAVPVEGSERIDARPGMRIPPLTVPSLLRCPNSVSGTSSVVSGTNSMAANLTGWLLYTHRASESPTAIWMGIAIAATVKGIRNPMRW